MVFIKNNFFILIILILLQSCSGGRIGNFLDSSFKNIEDTEPKEDIKDTKLKEDIKDTKLKEDFLNNVKDKIVIESSGIQEKNKKVKEEKLIEDIKNNFKNKNLKKSEKKLKNNKKISDKNISFKNSVYQPKSYKIIFILKDVDPKDPTENLRTILRNSDVNFEIEKIERYLDPKNKILKNN